MGTLVEVGPGFGTFAALAREEFERVVAIEPTPELAAACRERGECSHQHGWHSHLFCSPIEGGLQAVRAQSSGHGSVKKLYLLSIAAARRTIMSAASICTCACAIGNWIDWFWPIARSNTRRSFA